MKTFVAAFVIGFFCHYALSTYFLKSIFNQGKGSDLSSPELDIADLNSDKNEKRLETDEIHAENKSELNSAKANAENTILGTLDSSNCPTGINVEGQNTPNQSDSGQNLQPKSIKDQNLFAKFKDLISERKVVEMEESDLDSMLNKVLADPGLAIARSKILTKFENLKSLNGMYQGHLHHIDSKTKEFKSIAARIEIEFTKGANQDAIGKSLIDLENLGTSSSTGSPSGFKSNPSDKAFYIQISADSFFQITELDEYLKANYYKNNELAGFAKLKRIR